MANTELTILTLENDPDTQDLLGIVLKRLGAIQIRASTVDEALRLAEEKRPNAITVDLAIPGKDGWAFLDELANQPSIRDIPTIIVSALDPSLVERKAEAMGVPFVSSLDMVKQLPATISASIAASQPNS